MIMLSIVGCRRVKPQAPANKPVEDTAQLAAIWAKQRLVEQANIKVTQAILNSGLNFTQDLTGYWYLKTLTTELDSLQKGDKINMHVSVYTLDSTMLEDYYVGLEIGKQESLRVFDFVLPDIREGEEVTLIVPYYWAYGELGNEWVAPYTNVRIQLNEIEIEK